MLVLVEDPATSTGLDKHTGSSRGLPNPQSPQGRLCSASRRAGWGGEATAGGGDEAPVLSGGYGSRGGGEDRPLLNGMGLAAADTFAAESSLACAWAARNSSLPQASARRCGTTPFCTSSRGSPGIQNASELSTPPPEVMCVASCNAGIQHLPARIPSDHHILPDAGG